MAIRRSTTFFSEYRRYERYDSFALLVLDYIIVSLLCRIEHRLCIVMAGCRMKGTLTLMRKKGVTGTHFHKDGGRCIKAVGHEYDGGISILPGWVRSMPDVDVAQAGTWDIDLQDYVYSDGLTVTFAINTGALPTGITLNANGTFSGTVTDASGSGSVTFTATNANGTADSKTLAWTIP